MNRSTPGLPVHHQLLESTQTHVHCVGNAIHPSHPLSSPSPPALNLSQHQSLFKWIKQSLKSVQSSSVDQSCPTLCDPIDCSTPGFSITNSRSLLKLMSIESVMPSKHLFLFYPLLFPSSIFPSIRAFSNESILHIGWPRYQSFSFSISPSNEYSGLTSFRMDWLDLLAVQGTHKSLLQHHSSKASIRHSAFFIVQLSHPYILEKS